MALTASSARNSILIRSTLAHSFVIFRFTAIQPLNDKKYEMFPGALPSPAS
jgi:hypothetical protein